MAVFTPWCEISAKLSMRDTSVHTSSRGTHGLDNTKLIVSSLQRERKVGPIAKSQANTTKNIQKVLCACRHTQKTAKKIMESSKAKKHAARVRATLRVARTLVARWVACLA